MGRTDFQSRDFDGMCNQKVDLIESMHLLNGLRVFFAISTFADCLLSADRFGCISSRDEGGKLFESVSGPTIRETRLGYSACSCKAAFDSMLHSMTMPVLKIRLGDARASHMVLYVTFCGVVLALELRSGEWLRNRWSCIACSLCAFPASRFFAYVSYLRLLYGSGSLL